MKQCNIYVQPSRHEGYCITLAEARCLYKPIITTNFAGAREQIVNGKTGLVVSPNEKEIYDAVVKLLNHDFRTTFSEKLIKEKIDTVSDMEKIYSLFDIVE
jgi:glycosyltransferase involved in cell wall biosynthesis